MPVCGVWLLASAMTADDSMSSVLLLPHPACALCGGMASYVSEYAVEMNVWS
jgi:hypothetical protein